ncbi:hypothetical protein TNCV_2368511 [Trichonephila clavipes]|nr:hypothetical protein TNCV_2368511 [Trichonephila clavipes]
MEKSVVPKDSLKDLLPEDSKPPVVSKQPVVSKSLEDSTLPEPPVHKVEFHLSRRLLPSFIENVLRVHDPGKDGMRNGKISFRPASTMNQIDPFPEHILTTEVVVTMPEKPDALEYAARQGQV